MKKPRVGTNVKVIGGLAALALLGGIIYAANSDGDGLVEVPPLPPIPQPRSPGEHGPPVVVNVSGVARMGTFNTGCL